jgi:CubicO group peptidase (beta-lactamase class C family)
VEGAERRKPAPCNSAAICRLAAGAVYDAASAFFRLTMLRATALIAALLVAMLALERTSSAQGLPFALFERYLEPLRQQAGIPGMAAIIVQDGKVLWERGFGQRDVEAALPTFPDTPFYVADLSQTFAAVLLLQCVERQEFELDNPIGRWVPSAANAQQKLWQILSHTGAEGAPGFRYDPQRFAVLTAPIESCFDRPYRKAIADAVFDHEAMVDAVPGSDIGQTPAHIRQWFDNDSLEQYAATLARMAVPYRSDRRGRFTRNEQPPRGFDASRGVIASARDLAWFDAALFNNTLIRAETLAASWNNVTSGAATVPMGLGWFVQMYEGERLVWHFGSAPDEYSSLILKVPGRRLTLILLANSDGLSVPFQLSDGDVTSSLFARTFLRLFL